MANLRGGTHEKQIKDALHRMNRQGERKANDKDIHSNNLWDKREAQLRDFSKHLNNRGIEGKINENMNTDRVTNFLAERTANLAPESAETYIRGFGAMVESLSDNNINTSVERDNLDNLVRDVKADAPGPFETNRALNDKEQLINSMYDKHYNSGVLAEIQLELGYRVSEAHELLHNSDKYINDNSVCGLIGKGGREYQEKEISQTLQAKIEAVEKDSSVSQYQKDLQEENIKSHDLRITYAKELDDLGASKSEISEALNHSREEITNYYLARA